jgi:hypothetical protein
MRYRRRVNGKVLVGSAVVAGFVLANAHSVARALGGSPHPAAGSTSASTPSANQALGQQLAAADGWTAGNGQWACLDALWERESGWSDTADTRVTGAGGDHPGSPVWAYGIAQARPETKYPLAGRSADLGGQSDPGTQIRWGLSYIAAVYGSPCDAWGHEESQGWY